jgi:type IV secretory pathway TrbF-like protein
MAADRNTPAYYDQIVEWHNQRLWWALCVAGAIVLVLGFSLCVLVFRPRTPPWVIEVNSKGEPVGAVQPVLGTESISDNVIRYAISQYIENAFRIDREFEEEKMLLSKVYAMSTSQASNMLTDYYHANKSANDPLIAGTSCWQEVRVQRTLKLPAQSTFEVDYQTIRYAFNDENGVTTDWRATLQIALGRPSDINPLGIFVNSLDFSPEAKP